MMNQWKPEFANRFHRHEDELKWLYSELYHGDTKAWRYFTEMLYRLWEERPEELKKMDRAREVCPDWYNGHDLVGMLMYVNAFAGTLKGVQDKLDYLHFIVFPSPEFTHAKSLSTPIPHTQQALIIHISQGI